MLMICWKAIHAQDEHADSTQKGPPVDLEIELNTLSIRILIWPQCTQTTFLLHYFKVALIIQEQKVKKPGWEQAHYPMVEHIMQRMSISIPSRHQSAIAPTPINRGSPCENWHAACHVLEVPKCLHNEMRNCYKWLNPIIHRIWSPSRGSRTRRQTS